MEIIDYKLIFICSLEVVGFIQVLKNFMPEKFPKWLYAVFMCVLSPIFCAVYIYCPPFITYSIMTICVSQLGYEEIIQSIKKIVSRGSE